MPKVQPRDVGPALQAIRNFLLGRNHTTALRFEEFMAARTQPQPELPDGPCHGLSNNFYCNRDARREVKPPVDLLQQSLLQSSSKKGEAVVAPKKNLTPGSVYQWDHHY